MKKKNEWNKTNIIFKRNSQIQRIPWEIIIMFFKKTTINTTPTPHKTLHKIIRTLINSLHPTPTNTSSSSSLSLTNSLILSLEFKNSRSSTKNERRGKPIFFSLLFFHCCNWVSTRKEVPCCFSTQLIQGKMNTFIHSVFSFRFFFIFWWKILWNLILNFFPSLNS